MADELDDVLVTDITPEIIGERRAEWRAGFDGGIKEGTRRALGSEALGQIALELKVLRNLHECHCEAAEQRERLLAHWQAEARWWREEHDRVRDEYHGFAETVVRKFCK